MNEPTRRALDMLLNRHHQVGQGTPRGRDRCPTCFYEAVADERGVYGHRISSGRDPMVVRAWLELHSHVA